MDVVIFYMLAALMLAGGAAMVWLPKPSHAAYALIGVMVTAALMVAWLKAEFLALALMLALAGGVALLVMVGLPLLSRLGPLKASRPDEDRSFWAGIVAVLFLVITYRVLATTPWGAEDHSRLALTDAQRGLEAIRTLGETLRTEYALALMGGAFLVAVAIAVAFALNASEADA
ncbi:NADH:ubiquinone oxidoreductase subunit J [compost metagenome]